MSLQNFANFEPYAILEVSAGKIDLSIFCLRTDAEDSQGFFPFFILISFIIRQLPPSKQTSHLPFSEF